MPRPTLLLVHGFPLDRTLWDAQTTSLADAARVMAPDLPGFGSSSTAPRGTMTMDEYADHLAGEIGVGERVVIGGLSMGGYVALAFLAKYPDRVAGLILANTRARGDDEKAREGRKTSEKTVQEEGVAALAKGMLPKMLTPATLATKPDVAASVEAMMARQPPPGVVAALRGMALRPDRTPMLSSIGVPTLIITGSADTLIPPSESEAMAKAIPNSRLVVIPGVAHLSNVEAPEAFADAVKGFLAAV